MCQPEAASPLANAPRSLVKVIRLPIELRGRALDVFGGYTLFRALEAHPSAHIVDALLLTDARDMRANYGALNAGPKGTLTSL